MIFFSCHRCKSELNGPGALIFSPPLDDKGPVVEKYHICASCFNTLLAFIEGDEALKTVETKQIKNLELRNAILESELKLSCNIAQALLDEQYKPRVW